MGLYNVDMGTSKWEDCVKASSEVDGSCGKATPRLSYDSFLPRRGHNLSCILSPLPEVACLVVNSEFQSFGIAKGPLRDASRRRRYERFIRCRAASDSTAVSTLLQVPCPTLLLPLVAPKVCFDIIFKILKSQY